MTRRLIDETRDTLALRLLRSAELDTPPRGSLSRTAAAVGLSSAAVVGTATLGAGLQVSGVAGTTSKAMLALVAKGLIVGGVAGTVVVGGGVMLSELTREPSASAPAPSAPATLSEHAPSRASSVAEAARNEPAEPEPSAAAVFSPLAPPVGASPSASAGSGVAAFADRTQAQRLANEVAAIDRARGLLRSGSAAAALAELDRYQRSSASHELAAEAAVLKVEALVALGRRGEAAALAGQLLREQKARAVGDESPHRQYLEQVANGG